MAVCNQRINGLYIPILKDAEELTLSTTGDPFASRNTRLLMKTAAEKYPKLKFNLITNGILCDKINCDELGITDRLSKIMVSVHAATEKTYNKIVKNGHFNKVAENINWLSGLKKIGKLENIFLAFVVTAKNYEDIPGFIEFADKYNAKPLFWGCMDWGGNLAFTDEPLDVINPKNPKHNHFIRVLNSTAVKSYEPYFAINIRQLINDNKGR